MAVDDFNPADLDELVNALRGVEGVTASVEPAEILTPGVWVRFDGFSAGTLAGLGVMVTLHAAVAPTGERVRDLAALAALFNAVRPVVEELGDLSADVRVVGLNLPGGGQPSPALQIPLVLLTTN